jgi:hypothetical protein
VEYLSVQEARAMGGLLADGDRIYERHLPTPLDF